MLKELLNKYADEGAERIGFVLEDESVIEVLNGHDDPDFGAKFRSADMFEYLYSGNHKVIATWHTHPNEKNNLSGEDYVAFSNHPDLDHYIVGNNGVKKYYVDSRGMVKSD